nr:hypothetical protein [uncultured Mediterranean phage uvMED]
MAWYDNLKDATEVSGSDTKTSKSAKERSIGDYVIDMARAGVQGVTRGYGDELEAGAKALYQKFIEGKDFSTAYNETVKEIRGDIKSFREDDPVKAYGSEIAGSIAVNRGKQTLPRILKEGFVYGTGTSDADATTAEGLVDRGTSGVIGSTLGGVINKIAPVATQGAKDLINKGVDLTIGQATSGKGGSPIGGGIKMIEEAIMSAPIIGSPIRNAYKRSVEQLNKASYNQILEPIKKYGIDEKLIKKSEAGHELYKSAKSIISNQYDKLLPKLKFPNLKELQSVYDDVILKELDTLPKDAQNKFLKDMDDKFYTNFDKNGVLTGKGFKNAQIELRSLAKDYLTSSSAVERSIGASYKKVNDALFATLQSINPKYAQQLKDIDFSFKMLIPLEKATVSASATDGVFSPSQLMNAVKSSDKSLRKGNVASGDALLQDIAGLGQQLKMTLPNSGTATRADIMRSMGGLGGDALAVGGTYMNPLLGGALATGTMLGYSSPFNKYLRRGVTDYIAPAMQRGSPAIGGLLGDRMSAQ